MAFTGGSCWLAPKCVCLPWQASLGHTLILLCLPGHGVWGREGVSRSLVFAAATGCCVLCWSLGLKNQVGTGVAGVRTHNHTWGGVFACGLL